MYLKIKKQKKIDEKTGIQELLQKVYAIRHLHLNVYIIYYKRNTYKNVQKPFNATQTCLNNLSD